VSSRARWAEVQLRYAFKDPALLELALTHRSASKDNNERLEYLGDSFLNFAIDAACSIQAPRHRRRPEPCAALSEPTLAAIGQRLGIDAQLSLGPGELRSGGAQRAAILADAVEALIGAVLLDGGAAAAEAVVDLVFAADFESLPDAATLKDPKTRLQEWLQGRGLPLPSYAVKYVQGRDHEQTFVVECEVAEKNAQTTGRGQSRRRAEQDAAQAMLAVLTGERS
jgi:ribonuclease-3